ncbi:1-acyl-sn-glycerol-3-phosphate acyltransferase [Candidatus Dependentiae bacterium]|nr:1-acyl-sn-glycerol-3-phosphate acyltransferase [Candidatus Dependentiae bacterium]
MKYRKQQSNFFYMIARFILTVIYNLFFKVETHGAWRIPKEGGMILASNHQSYLDPTGLGTFVRKRRLRFMARETVFQVAVLKRVILWLGAFPIKRGKFDLTGMNIMINLLKEGEVVVMFPEGTRSHTGKILPIQPGIGIIAHKARVPIIPVYIDGFYNAWPRHNLFPRLFKKLKLIYGYPIHFDELYKQKASGKIYREIAKIVEENIHKLEAIIKGK